MRTLHLAAAATAVAAASLLLAPGAFAAAPGDNGTIKIHDAKTGEDLVKNEPHVCAFYLDAFFFDGLQQADWKIVEIPPTGKNQEAKTGAITLDSKGHGRTGDLSLPNGHYKLIWNFNGEHGKAKHKVFWTNCEESGTSGGPGSTGTPTGTPTGSGSPSTSPSSGTQAPTSAPTTGSPAASPTASDTTGDGTLASTGASVGGLTFAAVLLLGGGTALAMRRRKGQHN
ncbi:hypothetical protein C8250_042010 [Streptomyces sp. So13.3]|uniref:hypothetical protein n=1 Tax=Streptomyces TaxID=1883 RepID=UPI0011074310|nr:MULTISPECIES: hypothetical protein [Streptomyces]MCZ4102158.1 hypothetical protein [Streptomyces sp. H39-C1]QNA77506.1 hypothetical protein C8250_042010 [Streptomyces sp. So13.3]